MSIQSALERDARDFMRRLDPDREKANNLRYKTSVASVTETVTVLAPQDTSRGAPREGEETLKTPNSSGA